MAKLSEIPDFGYCPNCKSEKVIAYEAHPGLYFRRCEHCDVYWDNTSVRSPDGPEFGVSEHVGWCGIDEDGRPWFERGI